MRPRIVYTQIFMTLEQPLLGEFKSDTVIIIIRYYLFSAIKILTPCLALVVGYMKYLVLRCG